MTESKALLPTPPPLSGEKKPSTQEEKGSVGRGALALTGGKIYFLFTGLAQQVALKAVLGLGAYGALSTAQSIASIAYNPLIQSGIQGVSREIASADTTQAALIQRRLMKLHAFSAIGCALLFLLCAAPLATWLGAPHIAPGIQLFSIILFLYGLYAPIIGFINGSQRFVAQASLDILSATLRTIGLVIGAYIATRWFRGDSVAATTGLQVQGAVLGFCVATFIWVFTSARVAGLGRAGGSQPGTAAYLRIVLPILGGQFLLNLLFQADALLLRKFASEAAILSGQLPQAADRYVGAYRASQLFCFLPFQLLTSITFVLFPLLAKAQAQGKQDEVGTLIERGLRIAMLIAGLTVSVLVAVPEGLLFLVFGKEAASLGGDAMRILASGMGFFAILGVITSAMNSLGAGRQSFKLFAGAVVLVTLLCFAFTRNDPMGPRLLSHIASATSLAMVATTFVAAWQLKVISGAQPSRLSLARIVLSVSVTALTLPRFFEVDLGGSRLTAALLTLAGTLCAIVVSLLLLVLSGELKSSDWRELKSLFSRQKQSATSG